MSNIVYLKLIGEQQGDISRRCGTTDSVGNRWQRGHEDEIFVFSLAANMTNTGQGAHLRGLDFCKLLDKTSPLLTKAITNNEKLFLEFWYYRINRHGKWEKYYYMQLRGASISGIHLNVERDGLASETISVNYDYILSKHLISNTEFSYLALPADYKGMFVPPPKSETSTLNSAAVGRLLAAGGVYNGNIEGFRETAEKLGGDAVKGYDQVLNKKTAGVAIAAISIAAGFGLGRMGVSSEVGSLEKLRRAELSGLHRRINNTGEFSDLKVPMQMRYVEQAAFEGGIGLENVKLRIIRDPELKGKDLYGYTHPDGAIDLYPDAFTNVEQLIKTLGHERTHTMQIQLYKHPNAYSEDAFEMNKQLRLNENAAHGIEDSFWQYYNKNKTGKLERYK